MNENVSVKMKMFQQRKLTLLNGIAYLKMVFLKMHVSKNLI